MKHTGMRPSETFALLKSDIDLERGFITVNKAVRSSQDELITIGETKTRQSVRKVPISPSLKPILLECLQWSKHPLLLSDYYGNLLSTDDLGTLVRNVRLKANVDFHLYQLRHSFATDLLTQGTPLNVLRDLLGHESGSMSLDYATSSEKDRFEAVKNRQFS